MKSFVLQSDLNPEIGIILTVKDEDYDKAVELAIAGFTSWLNPKEYDERFVELYGDVAFEIIYASGWFEPTEDLLRDAGIEYEIDCPFDDEGELLDKYKKVEYELVY